MKFYETMDPMDKLILWLAAGFIIVAVLFAVFQPYFEARTFNKFSKTKASYFDALVSELRVFPDK